ncbi:hypothetical protein RchiOBHm_Chr5g0042851 [Rosa chinensis]|uniref:Uncharacterized protein n=1 Tax=Rosa chinensis TaxID=74649 RepID=A0A2P6QD72_ROSCH|nr:hypothetical protein RchiOBHm_Chr5g0042851 [Rosa chinensis]
MLNKSNPTFILPNSSNVVMLLSSTLRTPEYLNFNTSRALTAGICLFLSGTSYTIWYVIFKSIK